MPNQINASGKFLAGFLLSLFLVLPVIVLIAYWPNKLPKEGQCSVYHRVPFGVRLLDSATCVLVQQTDTLPSDTAKQAVASKPSPDTAIRGVDSNKGRKVDSGSIASKPKERPAALELPKIIAFTTLLLLLVAVGGFMGAMIHVANSFIRYVGADQYVNNWLLWYVVKPFVGTAVALIGYLAFEGKMVGNEDVTHINLYRVLALAILTGMFTDTATDKLKQIFETIFTPRPSLPDGLGVEVKITGINPDKLSKVGENILTVQGTNLKDKDIIAKIDGVEVKLQEVKSTSAIIKHTATAEQGAAGKAELQILHTGNIIYKIVLTVT